MAGEALWGIGKFITGIVIGALALAIYQQTTPQPPMPLPVIGNSNSPKTPRETAPNPRIAALTEQLDQTVELTAQLEGQIVELTFRLAALEKTQQKLLTASPQQTDGTSETTPVDEEPETEKTKPRPGTLSVASLIAAGIEPQQAEYIMRRQGEMDMQRLELRDRAIREGTLGTKEYANALRELNRDNPKLRDELGDDTYDRYLYASGQNNRVVVTSVIPGSAADQAGIRVGDMILNYGDSRVFTWPELRKATTEGYRGEYITLNVQRDQQTLSMLVPRGPLGIRMRSGSTPPLDNLGY